MAEETLTELVGYIIDISNGMTEYEIVFQPDGSEGSRIFVQYPSYNPMIWESIKRDKFDPYGRPKISRVKLLIKGELDNIRTDYEGVGIIKLLER